MPREKSNSITHLVKVAATEVVIGYFNKFHEKHDLLSSLYDRLRDYQVKQTDRINTLEKQVKKLFALKNESLTEETIKHINSIQSNVERAGAWWTDEEEEMLVQEFRTAIATIANNHKRSTGAIRDKISKNMISTNALGEGYISV